jgi:hypothetical protein
MVWQEKPSLDPLGLKFGALYTDHMLQVSWKEGSGWTAPSIDPVAPMTLHPCAQVSIGIVDCFSTWETLIFGSLGVKEHLCTRR